MASIGLIFAERRSPRYAQGMPRFALLRHECPPGYRDGPHWDLLLERPGSVAELRLATWSLQHLPDAWARVLGDSEKTAQAVPDEVAAESLPDHRARYLDYEGPISGDRGSVVRVADGTIEWIEATPETVRVRIAEPSEIVGTLVLIRSSGQDWRLRWGGPTD